MPNWLRWILVLPGAVGAYLGVGLLVGLSSEELPLPDAIQDWYSQAMNSVVGPWVLVYAGARIAPRGRRFVTSVVLAVLFGVLTGAIAPLGLLLEHRSHPYWWFAVSAIAGIVTVIVACVQVQRSETLKEAQVGPAASGDE